MTAGAQPAPARARAGERPGLPSMEGNQRRSMRRVTRWAQPAVTLERLRVLDGPGVVRVKYAVRWLG